MIINRTQINCAYPEGLMYEVYFAGCKHKCNGCYSPELWDFKNGTRMTAQHIAMDLHPQRHKVRGVVMIGGDPLYQPKGALTLAQTIREHFPELELWLYTGFEREEIMEDPDKKAVYDLCDMVKTGKYDITRRRSGHPASENQQIWRPQDE